MKLSHVGAKLWLGLAGAKHHRIIATRVSIMIDKEEYVQILAEMEALRAQKKPEEAIALAIAHPEFAEKRMINIKLAACYLATSNFEMARQCATKAFDSDPSDNLAQNCYFKTLFDVGLSAEDLPRLERFIDKRPDDLSRYQRLRELVMQTTDPELKKQANILMFDALLEKCAPTIQSLTCAQNLLQQLVPWSELHDEKEAKFYSAIQMLEAMSASGASELTAAELGQFNLPTRAQNLAAEEAYAATPERGIKPSAGVSGIYDDPRGMNPVDSNAAAVVGGKVRPTLRLNGERFVDDRIEQAPPASGLARGPAPNAGKKN